MPTRQPPRPPRLRTGRILRRFPEPTPPGVLPHVLRTALAGHDLLVPNARPDLIMDPHTLRMLEAG